MLDVYGEERDYWQSTHDYSGLNEVSMQMKNTTTSVAVAGHKRKDANT